MYNSVKKVQMLTLISVMLFLSYPTRVTAISNDYFFEEKPTVLVVFSSKDDEFNEHQRMLDMLIGHFTERMIFLPSSQVQEQDLEGVDFLFYYGEQRELLPPSLVDMISTFQGPVVALGYNAEQLGKRFSFLEWKVDQAVTNQVILQGEHEKKLSFAPQYVFDVSIAEGHEAKVIAVGKKDNKDFPLFLANGTDYYFASNLLNPPFSLIFAEGLYEVFLGSERMESAKLLGYLRLEDIHPLVDPSALLEIAKLLKAKEIPYMVAVIPVYTNPETKKEYHFSDFPELLEVLKYIQNNGGSIVLHGYTHQFRLSETGEGFEFWDVENNMPIYQGPDEEIVRMEREDFQSDYEYEQHLSAKKAYERDYIEKRLTRGIQELANYGIYPLAFEAPHYTMSQHGYEVISHMFSTYVGQLQVSDSNWEVMATSPYITKPTFLHGMQFLPETIGYVDKDDPRAIEKMLALAKEYQFVRGGMVAGFYHPYLGVERFIELIEELEKIEEITWIDLQQMNNYVQTDYVTIRSENGEIEVDIDYFGLFQSSIDYFGYHLKKVLKMFLWCIAFVGSLAVINFIVQIVVNSYRKQRMKRGESLG